MTACGTAGRSRSRRWTSAALVIAEHYWRHRHQEFLRFLRLIDDAVPTGWTCT